METNEYFEVSLHAEIGNELRGMTENELKELLGRVNIGLHDTVHSPEYDIKCIEKLKKQFDNMEKYIDLGLPSGTLWADRNYGADDEFSGANAQQWQNIKFEDTSTVPSSDDFQELIDNTDHKFVTSYKKSGASGMVFKSKVNDNEIFMPACGLYNTITSTTDHKLSGHYYTKTPCEKTNERYNTLYFNSTMIGAYVDISKNYNSQLRTIKKPR
jgi:hypothetical protein